MVYAENTSVSPERSLAEIQKTLRRYGADRFAFYDSRTQISIAFELRGRRVRLSLALPDTPSSFTATGKKRTPTQAQSALEQEIRRRWRALALTIKAKLEAVESGIETLDQAFMPYLLLPDGQTLSEYLKPELDMALATGNIPLLPSSVEAGRHDGGHHE